MSSSRPSLSVVWARSTDPRLADPGLADPGLADRLLVQEVLARTGRHVAVGRLCPACGSGAHGMPRARWSPSLPGPQNASGAEPASGPRRSRPPAVSISRGGGLTVVAVADTAGLGVDVEAVARFADGSVAGVLGLDPARGAEALAVGWVRTEAALKSAGTGLVVDPATVRLSDPDRAPAVVAWPTGVVRPGWLLDLDLGAGLRAAAAGTGPAPLRVSVRQAGRAAARG